MNTAAPKTAFARATKQRARARIGLIGPSGSGKTYTALQLAKGLAGQQGRVALIDTENGSASLYSNEFTFDVLVLDTFAPATYVEAIHAAEAAGYDVVIVDSLSHAWMGKDGALEMVDRNAARYQGNTFAAWRDVTPEHTKLVDALVRCKAHLIATMRAKTHYEVTKDDKTGKVTPRKIGLAPVQRDGMEYEFDIVADLNMDNTLIVTKSRYSALAGAVIEKPGPDLGEKILAWLTDTGGVHAGVLHAPAASAVTASPPPSKAPMQPKSVASFSPILLAAYRAAGWTDAQVLQQAHKMFKVARLEDLTPEQCTELAEEIEGVAISEAQREDAAAHGFTGRPTAGAKR